jgi:hypothetical protein
MRYSLAWGIINRVTSLAVRASPRYLVGYLQPGVCQRVLVIDGYDRQAPVMTHVIGQRLEIRTNQFDPPLLAEPQKLPETAGRLGNRNQIFDHSLLISKLISHIREAQPVNLGDFEIRAQVAQAAVKRHHMYPVPLFEQVLDDFFRPRGVSGTFAIHSVEDVRHARDWKLPPDFYSPPLAEFFNH